MSLAELFGAPDSVSSGERVTDSGKGAVEAPPEPYGVSESVTPAGIELYFQAGPKRLYRVRHKGVDGGAWKEAVSVTTVLDCLQKGGLSWWGMKIGVEGVRYLFSSGTLVDPIFADKDGMVHTVDSLVEHLKRLKLTVNDVKNQAGDRGSSVHAALEAWAETKILPEPSVYPEQEQGYITALRRFLEDSQIQPHRCEVMVGSLQHGFAGRFDLQAWWGGHEVVTHLTAKNEKHGTFEPGLALIDLKTSSGVYPTTHFRQLAAYEQASVECGYDKTDMQLVLNCQRDGRYQVKESTASFQDFLDVLNVYNGNRALK